MIIFQNCVVIKELIRFASEFGFDDCFGIVW